MKNLMKSVRITLAFCALFSVSYILVLWIFAQFAAPGEGGNAETVTKLFNMFVMNHDFFISRK